MCVEQARDTRPGLPPQAKEVMGNHGSERPVGRALRLESRDHEDPRLARDPSCCGTGRKGTALGETWQDLITDQKER